MAAAHGEVVRSNGKSNPKSAVLAWGRVLGIAASVAVLGLRIALAFFNPYSAGAATGPVWILMLAAVAGGAASYSDMPWHTAVVFLISLLPGLYFLATPSIFRWIGIADLAFFVAVLLVLVGKRRAGSPGTGRDGPTGDSMR